MAYGFLEMKWGIVGSISEELWAWMASKVMRD